MEQALSETLATNVWKLFPFRSGNRAWVFIVVKAYAVCIVLGFCFSCILNAMEGNKWLGEKQHSSHGLHGESAKGDTALDECFWYVFTTMHGIAFGEFIARGVVGRLIAMCCCAIGYLFTIFVMCIIMLSQLPGEKAPTLTGVGLRMVNALWPSYSCFCALIIAVGSIMGPYISRDFEGKNGWPSGMYWAWTTSHRMPYGDIYPDTAVGRMVTVPLACIGVIYMPYAMACVAVRCPTLRQHMELVGSLQSHPEDALGAGYVEPPQVSGSLQEVVMRGGYKMEAGYHDGEISNRGTYILACILLCIALVGCVFFGGQTPQEVAKEIEQVLELDLPPGLRTASDPLPPVIWTFWLDGYLPETSPVWNAYKSLSDAADLKVQVVTKDILEKYNKTETPFHPMFSQLAPNHKLDYLNAYFMHHYGGAFVSPTSIWEITEIAGNLTWTDSMDFLGQNDSFWLTGVKAGLRDERAELACEESNFRATLNEDVWCRRMQFDAVNQTWDAAVQGLLHFLPSTGPCCPEVMKSFKSGDSDFVKPQAVIVKRRTYFTAELLGLVELHLDKKKKQLESSPPPIQPCCYSNQPRGTYPLRMGELLEEIWTILVFKFQDFIKFDLPAPQPGLVPVPQPGSL